MMKRRKFILISLSVCLVSSLAGCAFGHSPSGTVKLFFERLEKGEIQKAKELTSKSLLSLGDKWDAVLAGISDQIKEFGGIKSIQIDSEQVIAEAALVQFSVEFKNGRLQKGKAGLVKEYKSWTIGNFYP
jgi:hypothetical protein